MMPRLDLTALGPAGLKLGNVLPAREVSALLEEAARVLGADGLSSPQKRYWFGQLLMAKNTPVLRVLARSIMAQAVLHGARPDEQAPGTPEVNQGQG